MGTPFQLFKPTYLYCGSVVAKLPTKFQLVLNKAFNFEISAPRELLISKLQLDIK